MEGFLLLTGINFLIVIVYPAVFSGLLRIVSGKGFINTVLAIGNSFLVSIDLQLQPFSLPGSWQATFPSTQIYEVKDTSDLDFPEKHMAVSFRYRLLDGFLQEWQLRKRQLSSGEITKEEYQEWKLNWPQTTAASMNRIRNGEKNRDIKTAL